MSVRVSLLAIGATAATGMSIPARATPAAPTDFFSEARTLSMAGFLSTGPIAGPVAQFSAPDSTVYYSASLGLNTTSGTFVETGSATATADRTTGTLHVAAGPITPANTITFNPPPAWGAYAIFGDTLHLTNPSAIASTITEVGFSIHIDGSSSPAVGTSSGGSAAFNFVIGAGDARSSSLSPSSFAPVADRCFINGVTTNCVSGNSGIHETWGNAFSGDPAVDQTFTGVFSFKGQYANVVLEMDLSVVGQYYFMDYSHTAAFSFDRLPAGVSYTSASGQFLTGPQQAVPEPKALVPLAIGVAGLMLLRRRPGSAVW